jgi:hypothetical protein
MNINKRQQVLAIAAAAIVGAFVLDKLVITPLTTSWKERSTAIADLRKSIAQGKATLDREQITRRRWNEMRKNTLPFAASVAEQEMLGAFDKWSRDSGVSVSSIKPQWKRGTTDDYSVLECRVDAAGNLAFIRLVLPRTEVYVGEMFPVELQLYLLVNPQDPQPQVHADGFSLGKMIQAPSASANTVVRT